MVAIEGRWVTQRKRNGEIGTFWREGYDRQVAPREGASFVCDLCGFASTTDHGRRGHVNRVHRAELQHVCPYCSLRFATPRALQTHLGFKHKQDGFRRTRNRPEVQREWNLRKNYGIGLADYEALLLFQGGRCATCPATLADSTTRNLHVDHDHVTGLIRGLLCSHCNRALGNVKDDADRLLRLAGYLLRGGVV